MEKIKTPIIETRLPTKYGTFQLTAYPGKLKNREIITLTMGTIEENILVRIHSECFTGDILHSLRCDCGEQLTLAMKKISKEKKGIIIYLRQEGRGIGLINKLKAYNLQDKKMDTIEANNALGFKSDLRNYKEAIKILKSLKIHKIKLMTNNPLKIKELEKAGFHIKQIPHNITPNKENLNYLRTKKYKMHHQLKVN